MSKRLLLFAVLTVIVGIAYVRSAAAPAAAASATPNDEGQEYAEFDFAGCRHGSADVDGEMSPSVRLLLHDTANHLNCGHFCGTHNYPYGGCDCLSGKCVCATKSLDFCSFDRDRQKGPSPQQKPKPNPNNNNNNNNAE